MAAAPQGNEDKATDALIILASLFAGNLVLAAVLASKIITVAGLVVPAGVLTYCLTFVITDIVGEIWGRRAAAVVVAGGFVSLVLAFGFTSLSIVWPPASFWPHQQAYEVILGSSARIMVASVTAYLLSQYHDVWAFHLWRRLTRGRYLWLRNNASTLVSQLVDSVIFISIAFYGSMPLLPLIVGQWLIKAAIAMLDTPLVYLGVYLLRRRLPAAAPGSG